MKEIFTHAPVLLIPDFWASDVVTVVVSVHKIAKPFKTAYLLAPGQLGAVKVRHFDGKQGGLGLGVSAGEEEGGGG